MKSIYLLRHAKSDWDADFGSDHERPLAPRGIRAAERVGRLIANTGQTPDRVYSSTAVRAHTTADLARQAGEWEHVPITYSDALYGADLLTILEIARKMNDEETSVLFVGHEPGWSMAVSSLCGGADVRMPTACLARVDFDVERWVDCVPGDGTLIALIPPRLLDS